MQVDWTKCAVIETVPGKVSGQPVIKHSRVRPQDVIANEECGEKWLADNYGLPLPTVREVLTFYHSQTRTRAPHLS